MQVLSGLVSCVSSGCKVAAGDGLETAQWHTVAVTSVCTCSVSKETANSTSTWNGHWPDVRYIAYSYSVFNSCFRVGPGSNLGQTPAVLKVSLVSLSPNR